MKQQTQIAHPGSGPAAGLDRDGVLAFLGIPYAAAPFGSRRLQPPEPPEPWSEVRDATRYGPTVPKSRYDPWFERMFPERWIPGEDCLNLNVWTPALTGSLPVLVWLHGGGYTNGSGSSLELAGEAFARHGVVCVTLNYRLAADGFLHLGDGIDNLGLHDQVAALEWVQDNVAAFGGDPARVTVGGHSAGGSSVTCLLASPRTDGLFAQAISQSTSGISRLTSRGFAGKVAHDLAGRLGVAATREALAAVPVDRFVRATGDLLEELEAGPDLDRWGPQAATMAPFAPTAAAPLPGSDPLGAVATGQGRQVRLLTGTVREETRLHLTPDGIDATTDQDLVSGAARYGIDADGLAVYRSNRPQDGPGDLLSAVMTDWYFRRPTVELAESRSVGGARDTWMYRIDRPLRSQNGGLGACHAVDVPMVFATTDVPETHVRVGSRPPSAVADLVHRTWVEFIHGADPPWGRYEPVRRATGVLSDALVAVSDPDGSEREVWTQFR